MVYHVLLYWLLQTIGDTMGTVWKNEWLRELHLRRNAARRRMGVRNVQADVVEPYVIDNYTYDADSGVVSNRAARQVGANGKLNVCIEGKMHTLQTNRVAWFLHYAEWPSLSVYPINGNRLDTTLSNLEQRTRPGWKKGRKRS